MCIGVLATLLMSQEPMKYRVIIADEGNQQIHYVNLANPSEKWTVSGPNRDMQLIGTGRLLVGDGFGKGFAEYDLQSGTRLKRVDVAGIADGINSAFRLSTLSTTVARDGSPAKILRIDSTGAVRDSITLAMDAGVRICRPTPQGTYLIGGKVSGRMCEFDAAGNKIWEVDAGGEPYMGVRLTNGNTLISNGYAGQMVLADLQGNVIRKFPAETNYKGDAFWAKANPNFFAGFQVLANGNIVVANWQGHGAGHGGSGYQLLEFDSALTRVVSYWQQDPAIVSSLHGVLVLDGLDIQRMHSDINGILAPLPPDSLIPAGKIKKWLALQSSGSYYLTGTPAYPGEEANARPAEGESVRIGGTDYVWTMTEDYDGVWARGPADVTSLFALTVYCATPVEAKIAYLNDDDVKIWKDGALLIDEPSWQDNEKASAGFQLNKGANAFLVRHHGSGTPNSFSMRFTDVQGNDLTSLSYVPLRQDSVGVAGRRSGLSAQGSGSPGIRLRALGGDRLTVEIDASAGLHWFSLYDLRGSRVYEREGTRAAQFDLPARIGNGVYMAQIRGQGVNLQQPITIRR
jgi:hypothetical protein